MVILDGKKLASEIEQELKHEIATLNIHPTLAAVVVGNHVPSEIYVRKKMEACKRVGIECLRFKLSETATQYELLTLLTELNYNGLIDAILVQLPLPPQINKFDVFDTISANKDVDCFHPINTGRLVQDRPRFRPCTPQAIIELLKRYNISTSGKRVAVINRSLILGQPLASMLVQDNEFANATITVCHDHTDAKTLKEITLSSDIVITAVGTRPKFVLDNSYFHKDSVVIDAAICRIDGKVMGDVDSVDVAYLSKSPGGVGPATITFLLKNTIQAARGI